MREISMAGYSLKIIWGCGMQNEKNRKLHVMDVMQRTTALTRYDLDKHSEWVGVVGLSKKYQCYAGMKKPVLDLYHYS